MKFYNYLLALRPAQKISIVIIFDILLATFATWLAFSIRLEVLFVPDSRHAPVFLLSLSFVIFFVSFQIYNSILRFITISNLKIISRATILYFLIFSSILLLVQFNNVPRSISIIQPIIFYLLIIVSRLSFVGLSKISQNQKRVLIYGAGSAGFKLSNQIIASNNYNLIGFIDDNKNVQGRNINNKKIFSYKEVFDQKLIDSIDLVIIAIPSIKSEDKNKIYNRLKTSKVKIRSIPSIDELIDKDIKITDIKNIELEEILSRDRQDDALELNNIVSGKTILITGAGGSIGSELSLQILEFKPKKLINLDNSEINIYNLENKIKKFSVLKNHSTEVIYSLTDIKDCKKVDYILSKHKPNLVFHAAAYKHLPIVEKNILQSIENNIFGTMNLIKASINNCVENFVLISTDKAVNPTSIMGKTKRVSEMLVQAYADKVNDIKLSIVRFGNVLDSSGSVIPLFKSQIETRSPLTITHPDVTRYFMLIPEAVNLIMQTLYIAKGGEVFVLDMGKPIKIMDLAKQMIRLSNLSVKENSGNGDIEIKIIGLREGEKLHEELMIDNEYKLSENKKIFIAHEKYISLDKLEEKLVLLSKCAEENNEIASKRIMDEIVKF